MRIRVNADDLGLSARVNDESFALIARGLVHSGSILINAPESADAVSRAKEYPECRFGVHLNVTQFRPLGPSLDLAPVLKTDGSFAFNVLWQIPKTRSLRRAVYLEWSAQIQRCMEFGFHPAHLDSHHDVHLIPEVFAVVKRLQWKFGIRRVRRRSNILPAARKIRRFVRDEFWAASARASGSEIADYVGGLNDFRHALESGEWKFSRLAKNASIELIVHPGNDFDPVFQEETKLLDAGWVRRVTGFHAPASAVTSSERAGARLSPKQRV